jgi:hypothetical protein
LRVLKGQKRGRKSIREGRAHQLLGDLGKDHSRRNRRIERRVINAGRPGWNRFQIVTERNLGVLAAKAPL